MIDLVQLTKKYNLGKPNELRVLNNIDMKINAGEMVAVMGRSGAGKSTLLHILACLDVATKGKYVFNGNDISKLNDRKLSKIRNKEIGILLQDFALIQSESAIWNVTIPLYFDNTKIRHMKEKAMSALEKVDMESFYKQSVSTLSGGQKQRVALARAIVNEPKLILADEPTGALDTTTAEDMILQLRKINKAGTTVIIVTHDDKVAGACDYIISIEDGKIINNR